MEVSKSGIGALFVFALAILILGIQFYSDVENQDFVPILEYQGENEQWTAGQRSDEQKPVSQPTVSQMIVAPKVTSPSYTQTELQLITTEQILEEGIIDVFTIKEKLERVDIRQSLKHKEEIKTIRKYDALDVKREKIYTKIPDNQVYGISISGRAELFSKQSFARIIAIDQNNKEYLIFGTDSFFVDGSTRINNLCEETCILSNPIKIKEIIMEVYQAEIHIDELLYKYSKSLHKISSVEMQEQENIKLNLLKQKKLAWIPGVTPISKLSYEEKKNLFTKPNGEPLGYLPNLQGFEYYTGGIFTVSGQSADSEQQGIAQSAKSNQNKASGTLGSEFILPEKFDWRDFNGENWNTKIKSQGSAGSCWAHSNIATLEAIINLYYNKKLDLDLSEQLVVDCSNKGPIAELSGTPEECSTTQTRCYPGEYCKTINLGSTDEGCDPYVSRDFTYNPSACDYDHVCSDWESRVWKITDFQNFLFVSDRGTPNCVNQEMDISEEEYKSKLITNGPMDSGITSWSHAMSLVGYEGKNDWKVVQSCEYNEFCYPTQGCLPKSCNTLGETTSICVNELANDGSISSRQYIYKCKEKYWDNKEWQYQYSDSCGQGMACINNACTYVDNFELEEGDMECTTKKSNMFTEYAEYKPGQGENIWIFKNSWGPNWGEAGYARIAVSLDNMGWGSQPLGPIVPPQNTAYWPTGFSNEINCIDNDGDGYCYWGISSERPASCPSDCQTEKDCNDQDPNLGPFISETNLNCKDITPKPDPCIETDEGYDIYNKGKLNGGENTCENGECEDYCVLNGEPANTGDALIEYYCEDDVAKSEKIECQNNCKYGACQEQPEYEWTQWFDRDNPSGNGDYETIKLQPEVCEIPKDIECQTLSGIDWTKTNQEVTCNTEVGFFCKNIYEYHCYEDLDDFRKYKANFTSPDEKDIKNCKYSDEFISQSCKDYKVRYLCPVSSAS